MHLPAAAGTPQTASSQSHNSTVVVDCFLHCLCKGSALFPSQILLPPPQTTQQRQLYVLHGQRRKIITQKIPMF